MDIFSLESIEGKTTWRGLRDGRLLSETRGVHLGKVVRSEKVNRRDTSLKWLKVNIISNNSGVHFVENEKNPEVGEGEVGLY